MFWIYLIVYVVSLIALRLIYIKTNEYKNTGFDFFHFFTVMCPLVNTAMVVVFLGVFVWVWFEWLWEKLNKLNWGRFFGEKGD